MKTKKEKVVPCVLRVETALKSIDDFASVKQLADATKLTSNQVGASLHHLRKHLAVDSVESGGKLWWFLTPGQDTRTFHLDERTPEEKPRAPRVRRAAPRIVPVFTEPGTIK